MTALAILIVGYAAYFYGAYDVVINARTWVDEVTYLIKSWRYVTGEAAPYSEQDPTWYMPLYFYQLGLWQTVFGTGIEAARIHSAILGGLSGLLIFDIVRRITGNRTAAALATLVLLTTPAVVFYFSSVTPTASVSLLLTFTIWLLVYGMSRPHVWHSLALGVLIAVLYFYRQNMILAAAVLVPVQLLVIRKQRWFHLAAICSGILIVTFALLAAFPERLAMYAIRLPIVTPMLASLGVMNDPLLTIQNNTISSVALTISANNVAWQDIVDGFLLPYAGLIIGVSALFVLARGPLRVLWAAPIAFLFLAATHYVGSLGYCSTCILPYTASYASIGGLCVGLTFTLAWRSAKREMLPPGLLTLLFCCVIIGLNLTASGLATRPEYRFYPSAMLTNPRPIPETTSTQNLAKFINNNTSANGTILPIHAMATIPLAVFQADRDFPVQGINMSHSYRTLKTNLTETERLQTLSAIEQEGLWTDQILDRWIAEDFDTIIFQVDPRNRQSNLRQRIEENFQRTAETGFRGWNIYIYERDDPLSSPSENAEPSK